MDAIFRTILGILMILAGSIGYVDISSWYNQKRAEGDISSIVDAIDQARGLAVAPQSAVGGAGGVAVGGATVVVTSTGATIYRGMPVTVNGVSATLQAQREVTYGNDVNVWNGAPSTTATQLTMPFTIMIAPNGNMSVENGTVTSGVAAYPATCNELIFTPARRAGQPQANDDTIDCTGGTQNTSTETD